MVLEAVRDRLLPDADAISREGVEQQAKELLELNRAERESTRDGDVGLDEIHKYLRGKQRHPSIPANATPEVRTLAKMSRVNVLDLIISTVAQALYVDGYRGTDIDSGLTSSSEDPAWETWQLNGMDKRQAGIHRAALAYGAAYATVLPGDPVPVIRGHSPRRMTAVYGSDDLWPVAALQIEPSGDHLSLRLYDNQYIHTLTARDRTSTPELLESVPHGAPETPVVRYLNTEDLDEEHDGEIERLMPIQDQIDETTFNMLVAQKYGAFRQRWIVGWTTEDENQKLKASAARLWTFDDDVKVGEFEQTELKGYLDSREASLRHAATISQTPAHELIGQMVNLSAEALVAAEASQRRKITERQMSFGESHEQVFSLAAAYQGYEVDPTAQVRWRDTESRALAQTVDALGKMAQMLGIPPQELWERIPGVTQQDVERWRKAFEAGDVLGNLGELFERQERNSLEEDPDELKRKADALGVLIRAGVDPDDAAVRVGLPGVKFTGAVPVSLRVPTTEAQRLED